MVSVRLGILAGCVGGLVSSGVFLVIAAQSPELPKEIRSHAFVLVDESGRVRGRLEVDHGSPQLVLFDSKGCTRLASRILPGSRGSEDSPCVQLFDIEAKVVAELGAGYDVVLADPDAPDRIPATWLTLSLPDGRKANLRLGGLFVRGDGGFWFESASGERRFVFPPPETTEGAKR